MWGQVDHQGEVQFLAVVMQLLLEVNLTRLDLVLMQAQEHSAKFLVDKEVHLFIHQSTNVYLLAETPPRT